MQNNSARLKIFDFTLIVVSLVIGMGIFRTATDSAKEALNPTIFFGAWLVGGLVAYCGALTYAEIGSRLPVTGGYYKVFSYAYHPSIAFAINCVILISNAASLAVVALIGSDYLIEALFPQSPKELRTIVAMGAILAFYAINLMGLKMSAKTQSVLMLIKIAMIVFLISALFFPEHYVSNENIVMRKGLENTNPIVSFGLAMVAVSFTYGGYQQTINFGNEVDQPQTNVPKGIFYGIAIIISLYLLTNLSYYKVVGFEWMQNRKDTEQVGTALVQKVYGKQTAIAFGALLFLCVLSYVNALLLSNPRVMYAMAKDGDLPKSFAATKGKKEVLFTALTTFAGICIAVLFFSKKVDELLSFSIFLDCFGMILSAAAIFKLRKKTKELDGTNIYKVKLFPLIPIIFIAAYVFVAVVLFIKKINLALIALAVMAAFVGIYFLIQQLKKAK